MIDQTPEDVVNDRLSDEYREAVGSVMAARQQYDDVCRAEGTESAPAVEAQENLARALDQRDVLRERYDRVIDGRLKR